MGAGLKLNVEDLTAESLGAVVERILADSARAKGIQRRALALPPPEQLISDLEVFAGGGRHDAADECARAGVPVAAVPGGCSSA